MSQTCGFLATKQGTKLSAAIGLWGLAISCRALGATLSGGHKRKGVTW